MSWLVEQLLESPKLPEIVDELQTRLAEERSRRERFYEELTEGQKAEFINGRVIMHSPAKLQHLRIRDNLHGLLQIYVRLHQLGLVVGQKALCVFPRNDYEPDVCFFGPEKAAALAPNQLKFPPPDFIAEVLTRPFVPARRRHFGPLPRLLLDPRPCVAPSHRPGPGAGGPRSQTPADRLVG